jgi:hypothetical protein
VDTEDAGKSHHAEDIDKEISLLETGYFVRAMVFHESEK